MRYNGRGMLMRYNGRIVDAARGQRCEDVVYPNLTPYRFPS